MSQADADLDETIGWDDPSQADAGSVSAPSSTEARASEVSSEHPFAAPDDDASFAVDPGRAGDSVERDDDEAAIASYYSAMEEVVEAGPGDDELAPPPSAVDWDEVADPAAPAAQADDDPFADLEETAATDDVTGKDPQFRLRPRSEIDRIAMGFMKVDSSLDLESALLLAKQRAGLATPPADEVTAAEDQPEITGTVTEIESRIRDLRRQRIEAQRSYDADAAADLDEQMLALEEQIPFVEAREREETAQREAEDHAWTAAALQHVSLVHRAFPMAADPNSAFATRMREIDEVWLEVGDDRYDDSAKAVVIAKQVSKELGIRPLSPSQSGRSLPATASSRSTAFPARPGSIAKFNPASGAARTTSDPTEATRIERAIEQVSDVDGYAELREAMFG